MLPDRVSNPGPLTYESGALPNALRGPAWSLGVLDYRGLTQTQKNPQNAMSYDIGLGLHQQNIQKVS